MVKEVPFLILAIRVNGNIELALKLLRKEFEKSGTRSEIKNRIHYQSKGEWRHRMVIRARARNRERMRIGRLREREIHGHN
jgi:ribosomal protein S21